MFDEHYYVLWFPMLDCILINTVSCHVEANITCLRYVCSQAEQGDIRRPASGNLREERVQRDAVDSAPAKRVLGPTDT